MIRPIQERIVSARFSASSLLRDAVYHSAPGTSYAAAPRANRAALGMILLSHGHAEGGHHRVPGKLLDCSAGGLDLRRHGLVEAIENGASVLRIVGCPELRRADEIGEQHARHFALVRVGGGPERRCARLAEARVLWVLLPAGRADRHRSSVRRPARRFEDETASICGKRTPAKTCPGVPAGGRASLTRLSLAMKGFPARVRASALPICRHFRCVFGSGREEGFATVLQTAQLPESLCAGALSSVDEAGRRSSSSARSCS